MKDSYGMGMVKVNSPKGELNFRHTSYVKSLQTSIGNLKICPEISKRFNFTDEHDIMLICEGMKPTQRRDLMKDVFTKTSLSIIPTTHQLYNLPNGTRSSYDASTASNKCQVR